MLHFTLKNCSISFHFTFFALLAFCCVVTGFEGGAFLLLTVLLHECGHIFAMIAVGQLPERITVSALGCSIRLPGNTLGAYGENCFVYLAGPAVNLTIAGLLFLFGLQDRFFFSSNLTIGIFQLLPVEPLDGGLGLHALLSRVLSPRAAEKITLGVSLVILIPLAILGFLILLRTRYNFTLLAMSLYLMFYLVVKRDDFAL